MKTHLLLQKIVFIVAGMLLYIGIADLWAAETPKIVINYIPPVGEGGIAEGRIVWDGLTAANAGQYAVIAMLRVSGGADYVKPTYDDYLNVVDGAGNFSINITTGGANDYTITNVSFYFVLRTTFNGVNGNVVSAGYMSGKYLGDALTVNRDEFWASRPQPPVPSMHPGFTAAGTSITLSCKQGEIIHYTLDGSDPATSASSKTYNTGSAFAVPSNGSLLVKAITEKSGSFSSPASMLWLPEEPLTTPLWGLCVSLALNGEPFGYRLSEEETRARMEPVGKLTQWVRTFGTLNNGLEYINRISKEMGLRTMIGVYVTNNATQNNAQIQGLRQILQMGPAPDLIAVGNEVSLANVTPAMLISCIDAVRTVIKEFGFTIPVGSVDLANITWSQSVLEKLDFVGINSYPGTWDGTPESEMINVLKQSYENTKNAFSSKFILLTETGTPYAGGSYVVNNVTQTPSQQKAKNYLSGFLNWITQNKIPAFYFEAYDEPIKSQNGGHAIEQYFGLMDGNKQIHPFYKELTSIRKIYSQQEIKPYPNPTTGTVFLGVESAIKIYDMQGALLQEVFGDKVDISAYPPGLYILQAGKVWTKVIKKR